MKRSATFLFCLAYTAIACAAEPLTWEAAVKIAVENNPDLISAQRSVLAKKALYSESYNGILPHIGLSTRYVDSSGHPRDNRWQAGATASMDLFNQSSFADIKASGAGFDQADANLRLIASSVLFSLRQSFASLLFAQEEILVSQRVRDIRKRDSELVTLRYQSGRESKGNMMRAQAELMQADADLAQSSRDVRAAQQGLDQQLGHDQFTSLVATGTFSTAEISVEPGSFDQFVNNHPSVLLQMASLSLAEADLKQAWSSAWPVLSASYNRSFIGPDYFPENGSWTAAGVLSLPIFGNGLTSTYFSVVNGRRNLEKVQQDMRSTRNQVRNDLESGWSGFAGARDQVKVETALLAAARQRNGEADVRYSSGLLTYENWEQIVTDRVNFERSLVRAQRDVVIAEAQWNKALGKGLGELQ